MKTKDFIKALQEADPSGELHVRIREPGEPTGAAQVAGYWDGSYCYEEGDGMVVSDKGFKVDVFCQDVDDFIWGQEGRTDNVRVDTHKPEETRAWVERVGKEARECHDKLMKQMIEKVEAKINGGWQVVQSANYRIGLCHKQWYVRNPSLFIECDEPGEWRKDTPNQEKLCQGECQAVLYSGLFTHRQDGRLIYWEKKEKTITEMLAEGTHAGRLPCGALDCHPITGGPPDCDECDSNPENKQGCF